MSGKFQLCECKRRDGRTAWIDTIEEDGTIRALHANAHTGCVEYHTHSPSGTYIYEKPHCDLMPNAPDPMELKQNMANARLIAAAPEMLAAIDTAIIVIAGTCVRTEGERQNLQIAHDQLSAARKKARGDA